MKKQWVLGLDATQATVHFAIVDIPTGQLVSGSFFADIDILGEIARAKLAIDVLNGLNLDGVISYASICLAVATFHHRRPTDDFPNLDGSTLVCPIV
ncbi:MAG: hypothetical protein MZU97_25000 [Bacillus subtilis]|nr:hypothetical protein [Bacillus subtilis]